MTDLQAVADRDREQRIAALRDFEIEKAWANVIATPDGRRVIWEILSFCGLFRNPYTGNAETNFLCGQQSVAQWVLMNGIAPNGAQILGEMMTQNAEFEEMLEAAIGDDEDETQ